MKDLLQRLTSRKFIAMVCGAVVLASNNQWTEFTALILAYVAAEGGADIVTRVKTGVSTVQGYVNPVSQNDDDVVPTGEVITGKPTGTPLFDQDPEE